MFKSSIKRTPDRCWIQWVGNLYPKVNHGIWTKDDSEKLHHLTEKLSGYSRRPSATIHDRAPSSPLGLDGKGRRGSSRERTKNGGFGASKKGTSLFEVKKESLFIYKEATIQVRFSITITAKITRASSSIDHGQSITWILGYPIRSTFLTAWHCMVSKGGHPASHEGSLKWPKHLPNQPPNLPFRY